MRAQGSGMAVNGLAGAVLVFLLFPVLVVVLISFSSVDFLSFPPPGLSLRWYRTIFSNWEWIDAFLITLQVGALTETQIAGLPAALLSRLSTTQIGGLVDTQVASLTTAQLGLPPSWPAMAFARVIAWRCFSTMASSSSSRCSRATSSAPARYR